MAEETAVAGVVARRARWLPEKLSAVIDDITTRVLVGAAQLDGQQNRRSDGGDPRKQFPWTQKLVVCDVSFIKSLVSAL